jgi:hypothetical protein
VLVEGSINSVRISVKVKKADDLEDFLAKKFMRFALSRSFRSNCRVELALQVPLAARGELRCAQKKARCGAPAPLVVYHILATPVFACDVRPGLRHFVFDHELSHGGHVRGSPLKSSSRLVVA